MYLYQEIEMAASVSVLVATTSPLPQCPASNDCTHSDISIENDPLPSYVAIISSGFSCLGSILIVVTFFVLKDMRTGAQKITLFLLLQISSMQYATSLAPLTSLLTTTKPSPRSARCLRTYVWHKLPSPAGPCLPPSSGLLF